MIVLKILLYIILAIAAIVLIVCILPAGAEISFIDGKLKYKVKLSFINIMDSGGGGIFNWYRKRKKKPKKPKKPKTGSKKKKHRKDYSTSDDAYLADFDMDGGDDLSGEFEDMPDEPEEDIKPDEPAVNEEAESTSAQGSADNDNKSENSGEEAEIEDGIDLDNEDEDDDDDEEKRSIGDTADKLIGVWESAQRPALKIFKGFHISDLYIDFIIANEDAYDCAVNYGRLSAAIYMILGLFSQLFTVRFRTVDVLPGFGLNKSRWDISARLYFRLGTLVIAGIWFLVTYIFRTFLPEWFKKRKAKKAAAAKRKASAERQK